MLVCLWTHISVAFWLLQGISALPISGTHRAQFSNVFARVSLFTKAWPWLSSLNITPLAYVSMTVGMGPHRLQFSNVIARVIALPPRIDG